MSDTLRPAGPIRRTHLGSQNLPGGVAGQGVDELNGARPLEAGQALLGEVEDRLDRFRAARAEAALSRPAMTAPAQPPLVRALGRWTMVGLVINGVGAPSLRQVRMAS